MEGLMEDLKKDAEHLHEYAKPKLVNGLNKVYFSILADLDRATILEDINALDDTARILIQWTTSMREAAEKL